MEWSTQYLYKLFDRYIAHKEGWTYAKQAKYKPIEVFECLLETCLQKTTIEDICTEPGVIITPDIMFYRLKALDVGSTIEQINTMMMDIWKQLKPYKSCKLTLLVDITDKEYYGDQDVDFCKGSKPKNGTKYFNRYLTACVVAGKRFFPIFFYPLRKQDVLSPRNLLEKVVQTLSPDLIIERILADGYFVAANVVNYLRSQKIQFLFNMKEYTSVKEHIEDFKDKQLQMALDAGVDAKNSRKLYRWLKKQQYLSIATSIAFDSKPDIPIPLCIVYILVKKKQKDATYVYYREYYSYCSNISENGEYLLKLYKIR